jgi:cobalt-zinc-cadmium efflux system protein
LPRGLHLGDVAAAIGATEGVLAVHDLHIWSLGSSTRALSCHVVVADAPLSAGDALLRRLDLMLAERFQIDHTTVQLEHAGCAISANGCALPVRFDGGEGHGH